MTPPVTLPEAAGPQDAVTVVPPRRAGSIRRTTNIDTLRPDGLHGDAVIDARARDLRTNQDGSDAVVAEATLQARVSPTRQLLSISTTPAVPALAPLVGATVGPGFRSRVNDLAADGCDDGSLLYLLLDDLPGATLVSGYALHHAGSLDGAPRPDGARPETARPPVELNAQGDVCAGWAHDATMMLHVREKGTVPVPIGPPAPTLEADGDPESWHVMAALPPHSVRRRRRLDVIAPPAGETYHQVDLHFRDSHVDDRGRETVMHEYTIGGAVDLMADKVLHVSARAHVLPWMECPGALASAARLDGMDLSVLRTRVRKEFVGRSTCTHLNDSLRSLADIAALSRELEPPV